MQNYQLHDVSSAGPLDASFIYQVAPPFMSSPSSGSAASLSSLASSAHPPQVEYRIRSIEPFKSLKRDPEVPLTVMVTRPPKRNSNFLPQTPNQAPPINSHTSVKQTPLDQEEDLSYKEARKVFLKLYSLGFELGLCEQALEESIADNQGLSLGEAALKRACQIDPKQVSRNIYYAPAPEPIKKKPPTARHAKPLKSILKKSDSSILIKPSLSKAGSSAVPSKFDNPVREIQRAKTLKKSRKSKFKDSPQQDSTRSRVNFTLPHMSISRDPHVAAASGIQSFMRNVPKMFTFHNKSILADDDLRVKDDSGSEPDMSFLAKRFDKTSTSSCSPSGTNSSSSPHSYEQKKRRVEASHAKRALSKGRSKANRLSEPSPLIQSLAVKKNQTKGDDDEEDHIPLKQKLSQRASWSSISGRFKAGFTTHHTVNPAPIFQARKKVEKKEDILKEVPLNLEKDTTPIPVASKEQLQNESDESSENNIISMDVETASEDIFDFYEFLDTEEDKVPDVIDCKVEEAIMDDILEAVRSDPIELTVPTKPTTIPNKDLSQDLSLTESNDLSSSSTSNEDLSLLTSLGTSSDTSPMKPAEVIRKSQDIAVIPHTSHSPFVSSCDKGEGPHDLDLSGYPLSLNNLRWIQGLLGANTQIVKLILQDCDLEDTILKSLLKTMMKMSKLEHLSLAGNSRLTEHAMKYICVFLTKSPNMKTLDISRIAMEGHAMAFFSHALLTTSLETLLMDQCQIKSTDLDTFASCIRKSRLRRLSLRSNLLDWEAGLQISVMLKDNQYLETLNLRGNQLEMGLAPILEALTKNSVLKQLNLRNNRLHRDLLSSIVECIKINTSLESLDLSGNALFGGEGNHAKHLGVCLGQNSSLKALSLANTNISCTDIQQISYSLQFWTTLETLDVTYNDLKINGVNFFALMLRQNHSLTQVDVAPLLDTHFSNDELHNLEDIFCDIDKVSRYNLKTKTSVHVVNYEDSEDEDVGGLVMKPLNQETPVQEKESHFKSLSRRFFGKGTKLKSVSRATLPLPSHQEDVNLVKDLIASFNAYLKGGVVKDQDKFEITEMYHKLCYYRSKLSDDSAKHGNEVKLQLEEIQKCSHRYEDLMKRNSKKRSIDSNSTPSPPRRRSRAPSSPPKLQNGNIQSFIDESRHDNFDNPKFVKAQRPLSCDVSFTQDEDILDDLISGAYDMPLR